jgi:hypothetical protein
MRSRLFIIWACVFAATTMNFANRANAQEMGRSSETGENLAEQLQQSNANQTYNLRLGPVGLRAEGDLTMTFNDNIGLNKSGRIADMIVTPMGVIHGRWEVSDLNTLTFNLGVGYQAYLFNSQYNCLLLAPDSEASFNFFVGDVAINLHDAFSYQQDPTQVGQLSNQTRLSRFQNDVGVSAKWDLSDVVLSADYDHANFWVMQSIYNYLTNQSDAISPKVTIKLNDTISTGVSATVSDVRYEQSFENDYVTESVGPFVTATLTNFLSLNAQAGGYLSQYDRGGRNGDNSDVSSYYVSGGVNHRINEAFTESLTAGREYLPGLTSNFTERLYANYTDTWQATKWITAGANLFWENLTDSDAAFRETSNRYGLGLSLSDTLSEHATLTFSYNFLLKDADPSFLSYYQNQGTVGMQYNF